MAELMAVAKYLYNKYEKTFSENMDEMKMHKLMYFVQRESLMQFQKEFFAGDFYGWKFGPVLKEVRAEYRNNDAPFSKFSGELNSDEKSFVDSVFERYAGMKSWKLSAL